MKALLVSTAAMGHLNPLLAVGRILMADGHQVMGLSSKRLRGHIEDIGATFRAFKSAADFNTRNDEEVKAKVKATPPGPGLLRFALEHAFADNMLPQYESIKDTLREFPADIIIGDHLMLGVLPMLLGPRSRRPAVALLGTTYLITRRDDGAPNDAGFPVARSEEQRKEAAERYQQYEQLVFEPVRDHVNRVLAGIGAPPSANEPLPRNGGAAGCVFAANRAALRIAAAGSRFFHPLRRSAADHAQSSPNS